MSSLRVAFYGDDVTGSVDALFQFARCGWRGRLFVGVPRPGALEAAARESEVVGIAGIARSLRTADLDAEVRPALAALAGQHPDVVQYKACSTIDSSPTIGSLGRVLEIGREVVGEHPVPLLFAQPDFGRYTVFGHHFAAEGGVVHRLDRQPTMAHHPSTPMDESDIVRHLARQTALPLAQVAITEYRDAAEVADGIASADAAGVVLDALGDTDLRFVGDVVARLARPVFAIGSGGLSRAIALAGGGTDAALPRAIPARGPVLAVSGSRSTQTRRQVEAARRAGWHVTSVPLGDRAHEATREALAVLEAGTSVVLASDGLDAGTDVLEGIARSAAAVVEAATRAGLAGRVVVCGGDTSSRVVRLLGIESLSIAANPRDNVLVLRAHAAGTVDGVEFVLKGGQVGADDLFESLRTMDG